MVVHVRCDICKPNVGERVRIKVKWTLHSVLVLSFIRYSATLQPCVPGRYHSFIVPPSAVYQCIHRSPSVFYNNGPDCRCPVCPQNQRFCLGSVQGRCRTKIAILTEKKVWLDDSCFIHIEKCVLHCCLSVIDVERISSANCENVIYREECDKLF